MKSVTQQINEILETYGREVNNKVREIAVDVAKDTAKDLKRTSPKQKGRGSSRGGKHYANGWVAEYENIPGGGVRTIVRNKTSYQLTHLLENGHAIVNQYGATGKRVAAIKHIGPAEERGINEYLRRLEDEL